MINSPFTKASRTFCSRIALADADDPVGSVAGTQEYLTLTLPLAWERLLFDRFPPAMLAAVRDSYEAGRYVRPIFTAPDPAYAPDGTAVIVHYRRSHGPDAPFAAYAQTEYRMSQAEMPDFALRFIAHPDDRDALDGYRHAAPSARDLLVCTHGTVDACCSTFGYPVYRQLRDTYGQPGSGVRVWRCSHFGGHRYAPTLVDLPEGRFYGYLAPQMYDTLMHRRGAVETLRGHYRGWTGLATMFEQIAEREAWMREGWAWLDYQKRGELLDAEGGLPLPPDHGDDTRYPLWGEVRLDFDSADGSVSGTYRTRLELERMVTSHGCGHEKHTHPQYRIVRMERTAVPPTRPYSPGNGHDRLARLDPRRHDNEDVPAGLRAATPVERT